MQLPIWLLISSGSFKRVFVIYAISYGKIFFCFFCFYVAPSQRNLYLAVNPHYHGRPLNGGSTIVLFSQIFTYKYIHLQLRTATVVEISSYRYVNFAMHRLIYKWFTQHLIEFYSALPKYQNPGKDYASSRTICTLSIYHTSE